MWSHIFPSPSSELFRHHHSSQEMYISHLFHVGIRADKSNLKPPSFHRAQRAAQTPSTTRSDGACKPISTQGGFDQSSQHLIFLKKIEFVVNILKIGKFHTTVFRISGFSRKVRLICQHMLMYIPVRQKSAYFLQFISLQHTHTYTHRVYQPSFSVLQYPRHAAVI